MSEEIVKNEARRESWKITALAIGAGLGALVGALGAYLLVKNAEKKDAAKVSVSAGEAFRLGVLILGLLRQIATLHEEQK